MLIRSILLAITVITLVAVQAEAAWWDGFADNGLDARVRALVEYNGELIIGGDFANAGTTPANFIAAWDGATWSALGGGMNDDIHALTVYNGELVAAGKFHTAGGVAANHIATWDGTNWSALGDGVDDVVLTATVFNGELIAAGYFLQAGGLPAGRIARWDGQSWSPLGSGAGPWTEVNALAVFTPPDDAQNPRLFIGGDFTILLKRPVTLILRRGGRSCRACSTPQKNGRNSTFNAQQSLPYVFVKYG